MAYACQIRGSVQQIALYDIDTPKVEAEAKNLIHGTQFTPVSQLVGSSEITVVADADVVVITAGAKPTRTLDARRVRTGSTNTDGYSRLKTRVNQTSGRPFAPLHGWRLGLASPRRRPGVGTANAST